MRVAQTHTSENEGTPPTVALVGSIPEYFFKGLDFGAPMGFRVPKIHELLRPEKRLVPL